MGIGPERDSSKPDQEMASKSNLFPREKNSCITSIMGNFLWIHLLKRVIFIKPHLERKGNLPVNTISVGSWEPGSVPGFDTDSPRDHGHTTSSLYLGFHKIGNKPGQK